MTQRQLGLFQRPQQLVPMGPVAEDEPRDSADTVASVDAPGTTTAEALVADLQNLEALADAVREHLDAKIPFGPRLPRGAAAQARMALRIPTHASRCPAGCPAADAAAAIAACPALAAPASPAPSQRQSGGGTGA